MFITKHSLLSSYSKLYHRAYPWNMTKLLNVITIQYNMVNALLPASSWSWSTSVSKDETLNACNEKRGYNGHYKIVHVTWHIPHQTFCHCRWLWKCRRLPQSLTSVLCHLQGYHVHRRKMCGSHSHPLEPSPSCHWVTKMGDGRQPPVITISNTRMVIIVIQMLVNDIHSYRFVLIPWHSDVEAIQHSIEAIAFKCIGHKCIVDVHHLWLLTVSWHASVLHADGAKLRLELVDVCRHDDVVAPNVNWIVVRVAPWCLAACNMQSIRYISQHDIIGVDVTNTHATCKALCIYHNLT